MMICYVYEEFPNNHIEEIRKRCSLYYENKLYASSNSGFLEWFNNIGAVDSLIASSNAIGKGNVHVVEAWDEDKIIGITLFISSLKPVLYIETINTNEFRFVGTLGFYIKPEYRRRGIAKRMAYILNDFLTEFFDNKKTNYILAYRAGGYLIRKYMKDFNCSNLDIFDMHRSINMDVVKESIKAGKEIEFTLDRSRTEIID